MHTLTVTLDEAQFKALSHVAYDPQEWLQTVVDSRANEAMDLIFRNELEKALEDDTVTTITADKTTVVLEADIKTAAQMHNEQLESMRRIRGGQPPTAE